MLGPQSMFDPGRRAELFHAIFDAHPSHVCMLDLDGRVLATNRAWARYGEENGLRADYRFVGQNYLSACEAAANAGDPFAAEAMLGLLDVMHTGRQKFVLSYPCHAPHERRWYRLWVEPQMPHAPVIIVAHEFERSAPIDAGPPGDHSTCIARG